VKPVPGNSLYEQTVAVAGALAELGVGELVVDGRERLMARQTDLPGRLCTLPAGTRVRCADPCVEITVTESGLMWESDPAGEFARAMSR
jgi:hypothetical protein